MSKSLDAMMSEVIEWAQLKGWEPDEQRTFGDEIALIHSEASEALEAYREIRFMERTAPIRHVHRCRGVTYKDANCGCVGKPEDVASEFADILIRVLHYSYNHGINLEAEYERKMKYNRMREWRHGGRVL